MKFQFDFDGSEGIDERFMDSLKTFLDSNKETRLSSLISEKMDVQVIAKQLESSKKIAEGYARALESFKTIVRNNDATNKSVAERHRKALLIAHESVSNSSNEVMKLRREVTLLKAQLYDLMYPIKKRK